ncbi:MAG: glycosyltransferase family 4 protein [Candidatus Thiodiazotropha sp. L084R]
MTETGVNQPIQILDIRDSPWHDGPGRTIIEVASGLKAQGIDIRITSFVSDNSTDSDYLEKAREKGLECIEIKETKTFDSAIVDQIVALHQTFPFTIIHSHDLRSNVYGLLAARKLRLPIIATMHGWVANSIKRKAIMVLGNLMLSYLFDAVITVSNSAKQRLDSYLPTARLMTIHNTLATQDYKHIDGGTFRRSLNIPKETPLLAKIGRLSPEKRQDQLILASKQLVEDGYDFKVLFIGVGPEESRLRLLSEQLGIADFFIFTGFIEDMLPVYSEIDLVVQTSSTEGLPNVILEAMLMRVPVIATDVGGTSEIVNSSEVGRLIPPENESVLVSALKSFLDAPEVYRNKLDKAEQRIRDSFDSDKRLEKMAALYRDVNGQ